MVLSVITLLLSGLCAHGQIWVRTLDGRTSSATEVGRVNGEKVRIYGASDSPESGVSVPVTFLEEIQLPDGCRMVFNGAPLTLEGIRDLRFLSGSGDKLYAEDLYKLSAAEVRTLFGEERYKAYHRDRILMNVGEVSMVIGAGLTMGLTVFVLNSVLSGEKPDLPRLSEGTWEPYALWGEVALFTGGLVLALVGNRGIKRLRDDYNLGVSKNGVGLVLGF